MQETDPAVRLGWVDRVAQSGGPDAADFLTAVLTHERDEQVLARALRGVGDLGLTGLTRTVKRFTRDRNPQVRSEAVAALEKLRGLG